MSQVTHLASGALNRSGDKSASSYISRQTSQLRHGGLAGETYSHRRHPQSISSVGRCNGPHHGGGPSGTRQDQDWMVATETRADRAFRTCTASPGRPATKTLPV